MSARVPALQQHQFRSAMFKKIDSAVMAGLKFLHDAVLGPIGFAILASALIVLMIGKVGDALVPVGGELVNEKGERVTAVEIAGVEEGGGGAAGGAKKKGPESAVPLLAAADAAKGESAAKKCIACHTFTKGGAKKIGPNLWGVVGKDVASADFEYSEPLKKVEGNWDYAALDKFLLSPKKFAPGTKMSFGGVKKTEQRADLIAYLRSLADSPIPLPEKTVEKKPEPEEKKPEGEEKKPEPEKKPAE